MLLGRDFSEVHKAKDNIYALMMLGKSHRIYGHDPWFNLWLAVSSSDPQGTLAACILHDLMDKNFIELPNGNLIPRQKGYRGPGIPSMLDPKVYSRYLHVK